MAPVTSTVISVPMKKCQNDTFLIDHKHLTSNCQLIAKSPRCCLDHVHTLSIAHRQCGRRRGRRSERLFLNQTTTSLLPGAVIQAGSPTPLSSTPGLFTQRRACSILPSKVTAGLAGLMLATARLVLDCRVSSAAPICFASARASGLSPLPLRQ